MQLQIRQLLEGIELQIENYVHKKAALALAAASDAAAATGTTAAAASDAASAAADFEATTSPSAAAPSLDICSAAARCAVYVQQML